MKLFIRFFSVALLLLAAGVGVGDVDAQQTRYYTSLTGKATTTGCTNPADPCKLETMLGAATLADNDVLAIMVSASSKEVTISSNVSLSKAVKFAFYMNDGSPSVNHAGSLTFSGTLSLESGGRILRERDVTLAITSSNVVIEAADGVSSIPGAVTLAGPGSSVRVRQPDGRRIDENTNENTDNDCLQFDDLVIAGRTQITPNLCIEVTKKLTVNARLQLRGTPVLKVTADPADVKDADKSFIAVNSSDGIESTGGTLRIEVGKTNKKYVEPNLATKNDPTYLDTKIADDKGCFHVKGSGPIEMDFEVRTAQYVCISVPTIGARDTSTVYGGTLRLSSTTLNGHLVNKGAARTDVESKLTLKGDLTVDGRWVKTSFGPDSNPVIPDGGDGILTPADYTTWTTGDGANLLELPVADITGDGYSCDEKRRPGVHFHQSSMLEKDMTIGNIYEQATPASGVYAAACQSGVFFRDSGVSTLKGTFKAQELDATTNSAPGTAIHTVGAYVHLGCKGKLCDGKEYHNLVLEGDVDISSTKTIIDMAKPAGIGTSINACSTGMSESGVDGNKLILGGSAYQNVEFSTDVDHDNNTATDDFDRTLMLDALTIDKSGGAVEFDDGAAGVDVAYLEPLNGTLATGTTGSSLLGFQTGGAIAFTGGNGTVSHQDETKDAYKSPPSSVVYASGKHTIGKERGGAGDITILSDDEVTISGGKITNLNLYTGTLKVKGALEVSGTIEMGNSGDFDLSAGSLKHTGADLKYSGNMARSAGMAWMADTMMAAKITDTRTITVNQVCKDPAGGLKVALNAGYTSLGGHLKVINGALDLSGGGLVVQDRVGGNTGAQEITVGDKGMICDSMGSASCSGSSALEEELDRGDALLAALDAIREDDSEETRAALDKAADAFKSTEAKTGDTGMGIMVGYVEKDQLPLTNIIMSENKLLPMVTAVGGQVTLSSQPEGKKLSLAGLTIKHKSATVTAESSVGRIQLTGDLMVSSGNLVVSSPEAVLSSAHMQSGGSVVVSAENAKYTVMGTYSVTGGTYSLGETGTLSLAGDVMVDLTKSSFLGLTELIGTGDAQMVSSSSELGSVTVNAGGGVLLSGDVVQGASADLTLRRGHITTGDHEWMIKNPGIEHDLAMRTAVPTNATGDNPATIFLGNRASFVAGAVSRKVAHGDQGLGSVKGGYLFPVGTLSETRNRYRPLILSFATDVSPEEVTVTTTSYSGEVTWPSAGITTASTEGGTYTLNTYAPIMWMVEFSAIPALGATVRVAADGLVGVNDSNGLRLVQWDCDGTNVRLAGEFDLSASGVDQSSVSANGRINGVPNTTMDGVDAAECSIIGIAANYAENPIGTAPPAATPMANVQLIHNIVGATVDVYVDDVLVADNFAFQTATPLSTQIAAGQHMVHVTPATAPDNSTPIASIPVVLAADGMYTVVANGDLTNFNFAMLSNTRSESVADGKVEFRIVHGAASLGEVDLRSLTETGRWANNLSFNEATGYRRVNAALHNVELLDGHTQIDVFELDLGDYINQTLVLALSGTGTSSAQGLTLMGVATDGSVFFPQVVTSAETEELPSEFALQGNYPNPFNPSTQIQFDLPSTADVEIQVIDLLGRMVLSLPSQSVEAGANRTVELDGSSLASGTYLYRLIAKMDSGIQVETGRMVLIK